MIVVVHQAAGVAQPVEPFDHLRQHLKKPLQVDVIQVDLLTAIAAGSDMLKSARELYS